MNEKEAYLKYQDERIQEEKEEEELSLMEMIDEKDNAEREEILEEWNLEENKKRRG